MTIKGRPERGGGGADAVTEPVTLPDILDAWDKLHGAIQRTLTAQPFQMTAAVAALEAERQRFHPMLQAYAFKAGTL